LRSARLRSKFLLALLAVSVGLTAASLFAVRLTVQDKVRESLRQDLRTSVKTYQSFEAQRNEALTRSAELIANLPNVRALMTTRDQATIQDASTGILKLSGADLLVFVDRTGKASALQPESILVNEAQVQAILTRSLERGEPRDWWFTGGHLYQVLLQPIEFGEPPRNVTIGYLVVGHDVGAKSAAALGELAASDVVFRCGDTIVASTLEAEHEREFSLMLTNSTAQAGHLPEEAQLGAEHYLISTVKLAGNADVIVSLSVLKSFDKATAFLSSLNRTLVLLGLLILAVGALLAFFISDNFTQPLAKLVGGVKALEAGDYDHPLELGSEDEVGLVTAAFSRLRESLQKGQQEQVKLEARLRQAHKMEAIGRLAGGVAHDFNNLLTIIRGHSDLLADRPGADDSQKRSAEQIQKASNRAVAMTRQLLAFSRMQVLQPSVLDLNAVISEMGKMLPRLIGEHIEYTFMPEPKLATVKADPGQIEQVLMNLAVNARDAMPDGGKLLVRTANVSLSAVEAAKRPAMGPGEYVLVSVYDTGEGMTEETKARIFEPFFTTKEVGKGTGLGLATVYGIVKQSGGFIWVESAPGKGATFDIYFPQASGKATDITTEPAKRAESHGTETILLVEDEPGVRELAGQFLRGNGYSVLEAPDGVKALEVAAQHSGPIHLLLSDMVMPRMGGQELVERLRSTRTGMKFVLMSGYSEYNGAEYRQADSLFLRLGKPFSMASLVGKVREALGPQQPAVEGIAVSEKK
jgi:signal transduction histidine kinase